MDWKQELLKRLDTLADKLGTTAAYLWHVLVKQRIAEGIENILIGLVWTELWIAILIISHKMRTKIAQESDEKDNWIAGGYAVLGVGQMCLLGIGTYLFDGIVQLINPEYFALERLLQTIGK